MIEQSGGQVLRVPMEGAKMRWRDILQALGEEGIESVMIEGGATVINQLLSPENAALVSALVVTVAPVYLGRGGVAVNPDERQADNGLALPVARLRDVIWQPLGEDVVLCGRIDLGSVGIVHE